MPDYFNPETNKTLHFFLNEEDKINKLYITNVLAKKPQFQVLEIPIDFNIPYFHKSITLPNGQIYVTGGR